MGKLKVALLGLGNVGSGVYQILNANKSVIEKRSGYEIEVSKILVRDKNKPRPVEVDEDIVTTDINDILDDEEISIVVELMGGEEPAKSYILRTIEKKKHIVTANKLLMAKCGVEVFNKAKEVGAKRAEPIPWKPRDKIIVVALWESPTINEPIPNINNPIWKILLRPQISPARPPKSRKPPKVNE